LQRSAFNIYNASAGSGKTFTLTKAYLKLLLSSDNPLFFKNLLAITFTNKAVGEMKNRIIDMLRTFSQDKVFCDRHAMFMMICEEAGITPEELQLKSKNILWHIIHNYGAFDISTIDGFTHRIIRTFSKDLQLPPNFEVELDVECLLTEAVDSLINQTGKNNELTRPLIDFAIEKTENDKSWDISFDFYNISKLLTNENHLEALNWIKDKSQSDFKELKKLLHAKIKIIETQLVEYAYEAFALIDKNSLDFTDFTGGKRAYLPNYFLKISNLDLKIDYGTSWISNIEDKPLYPEKSTSDYVKAILDSLKPQFIYLFNQTRGLYFDLKLHEGFYKNLVPLSVLSLIKKELDVIKTDQNKLLISEFNTLISQQIKGQPTPFIYERLGEKFKHYFIDEFQDTSVMQWENLTPLIDNALSATNGSLLLVGDAKQAIYRWRGGKVEQFINLCNATADPFQIRPTIDNLDTNYRSSKTIIEFNNSFFDYIGSNILSHDNHSEIYNNASQKSSNDKLGYVNLSFIDNSDELENAVLYAENVLKNVQNCLEKGYSLSDICVLVRRHNEGVLISDFLSQNNINITSSETLLISNSQEVCFINNFIKLLVQPQNKELQAELLKYLCQKIKIEDTHLFFKEHIKDHFHDCVSKISDLGFHIDVYKLLQLPLYELIEEIIRVFNLNESSDAFLQYYLDFVLEYTQKQNTDILQFIDHYEQRKHKLSISMPQNLEAVKIMTIHKSKGLEFPIVIFPFAELDIYKEIDPKIWYPLSPEEYNNFNALLLNYNKNIEHYGEIGADIYSQRQSQLELDHINLLYVALTRPTDQLYIISKEDYSKGEPNPKTYSGFFLSYLKSKNILTPNKKEYEFGVSENKTITTQNGKEVTQVYLSLHSLRKEENNLKIITKSGMLWDTKQKLAIEKGNLIHNLMSKIKTSRDIPTAMEEMMLKGDINSTMKKPLLNVVKAIIEHNKLKPLFTDDCIIYNEKDIILDSGKQLRPDRLNINSNNEVAILDYKTGTHKHEYINQLNDYECVMHKMNFVTTKKYLVYINDEVEVMEV